MRRVAESNFGKYTRRNDEPSIALPQTIVWQSHLMPVSAGWRRRSFLLVWHRLARWLLSAWYWCHCRACITRSTNCMIRLVRPILKVTKANRKIVGKVNKKTGRISEKFWKISQICLTFCLFRIVLKMFSIGHPRYLVARYSSFYHAQECVRWRVCKLQTEVYWQPQWIVK